TIQRHFCPMARCWSPGAWTDLKYRWGRQSFTIRPMGGGLLLAAPTYLTFLRRRCSIMAPSWPWDWRGKRNSMTRPPGGGVQQAVSTPPNMAFMQRCCQTVRCCLSAALGTAAATAIARSYMIRTQGRGALLAALIRLVTHVQPRYCRTARF